MPRLNTRLGCAVAAAAWLGLAWPVGPACGQPLTIGESPLPSSLRLTQGPDLPLRQPAAAELPAMERTAPADGVLTLNQVESLAVASHPALRAAEGEWQAARGRWLQVGLPPNPVISYAGNEVGNEGTAGQQGGFVSQEFVTANKRGLSRAVASRDVAAAEQRLARVRLAVLTTARTYYYQALAAERAVALAGQMKTMSDQAVQISAQRLAGEIGSRVALVQSQNESESAALLELDAANRFESARRRLAVLIGRRGDSLPPLDEAQFAAAAELPAFDWETTRSRVLSESPQLAEARLAVEGARWAVQRAVAGRVPNVDLQAGVQYDYAARDTIAGVQLSVPLPVFDRNQGAIAAACGELAAAQASLEEQELALEQRLTTVLRDYLTARARVAKYAVIILPGARRSLDMIAQAYEQGELDYLQLVSAQKTYTERHVSNLQALETAWQKWAEIEGLLVEPLADGGN
jgi:cobalt-zinc-cadmium efflux system outer membrane protein